MSAPFPRFPIPYFSRNVYVGNRDVRSRMRYQFGQWYALGDDVEGNERVGVGKTRALACESLKMVLGTVDRYYTTGEGP